MWKKNGFEKVLTEAELFKKLKQVKSSLSLDLFEYLMSVFRLEFSVVNSFFINDEERSFLLNFDVYRDVVIYNIYHRAMNFFESNEHHFPIFVDGNNVGFEGISVEDVFYFNYNAKKNSELGNDICYINLYQLVDDENVRLQKLRNFREKLDCLKKEKIPYDGRSLSYDGFVFQWYSECDFDISKCERELEKFYYKRKTSNYNFMLMMIQNYFNSLILNDYGINGDDDFCCGNDKGDSYVDGRKYNFCKKKLVKKMPGICVNKYITYL